jgi:hypothetical protein
MLARFVAAAAVLDAGDSVHALAAAAHRPRRKASFGRLLGAIVRWQGRMDGAGNKQETAPRCRGPGACAGACRGWNKGTGSGQHHGEEKQGGARHCGDKGEVMQVFGLLVCGS